MSKNNEDKEQEQEIIQPTVGMHRRFMMEGEKAKLDNPRRVLWKWLFSYIGPYMGKFILFFIFLLLGTIIQSFIPLIQANMIDYGIALGDSQYLYTMTLIYGILLLFLIITNYFAMYGMGKISHKATFDIRNDLFFKLQDMSLTYYDQRPSGDIISIMTNDITILNQLIGGQLAAIITNIVSIAITIIVMFLLNVFLALISLVVFPLFFLISFTFRRVAIGLFKESRQTIGKVTSSIQENIAGAKVVKAYGQEERASHEFDKANKANYNAMVKIRRYMATIFPLVTFITTTLTAAILLVGGFAAINGFNFFGMEVSPGVLTAYITILAQFFRPFMMLMQIQEVISSGMAASDRIYSLLNEGVEILDPQVPLKLSEVKGELEFIDLDFGYILDNNSEGNPGSSPKVPTGGDMASMINNPMMKRAIEMIKSYPEPYSSFMMNNTRSLPMPIRQKLFMSLMGSGPENAPKIIDQTLAEFNYAVPNTEMAKAHPEYKTSFESKTPSTEPGREANSIQSFSMGPMPPEAIEMMIKFLERSLRSKTNLGAPSGGMGGETGGMMGGPMNKMSPQMMVRMLASSSIPSEVFDRIPQIVKDAILEQKKIIQHEQSKGYVLKEVSLKIPAGTTLAVVGETGAGKTTLVKLIARFYDVNNGKVIVDDVDIRSVTKEDLRKHIGLVPQNAFLFTGTIRDNLLYAFDNPSPEIEDKMIEVSKFLGLHNFIESLHKKYETKLKENGSNISIGQRQLIAFARALITDPKILILDEATSSVDPYTESLIQDALNKARKGRTTIIIAHRLSTIKNADHIVVLGAEKRGIVEQGNHESLMALNGKYKRLLDMQHKDIAAEN